MSPAFLVAVILAVAWNVVILTIARLTSTGPFAGADPPRSMTCRIECVEVDAATGGEQPRTQPQSGTARLSRAFVPADSPCSATIKDDVPYADASVTVATTAGTEARCCTVCLN
jgi:hypothetical protein